MAMIVTIEDTKNIEGCVIVRRKGEWRALPKEAYFEPILKEIKELRRENSELRALFDALKAECRAAIEDQKAELAAQKAVINAKLKEYHDAIREIIEDE